MKAGSVIEPSAAIAGAAATKTTTAAAITVAAAAFVLATSTVCCPAASARTASGRSTADAIRADAPQAAAYRVALAQRVHAANADWVYAGRPPTPLRAIVVMQLRIDGSGRLLSTRLIRSNGYAALQRRAADSLRRAQPLPVPPATLTRASPWLTETWLFDADGRFQLRTLALPQDG